MSTDMIALSDVQDLFLPNISIVAAPMQFEGKGSKSIQFDYGDITNIPVGAALDADITLNQYDVALFWGIPALKTATAGTFNIDLGLNVRWIDLEAKLHATDGGTFDQRDEASVSAPIPMLFLAIQIMPTDSFGFEAEGRGLSVGDNKLYSIIGRVRYNFTGPVFVAGGYRYDKLEIDLDDVEADIEFSGPFIEMGLQF
jgi:outer membrane protein